MVTSPGVSSPDVRTYFHHDSTKRLNHNATLPSSFLNRSTSLVAWLLAPSTSFWRWEHPLSSSPPRSRPPLFQLLCSSGIKWRWFQEKHECRPQPLWMTTNSLAQFLFPKLNRAMQVCLIFMFLWHGKNQKISFVNTGSGRRGFKRRLDMDTVGRPPLSNTYFREENKMLSENRTLRKRIEDLEAENRMLQRNFPKGMTTMAKQLFINEMKNSDRQIFGKRKTCSWLFTPDIVPVNFRFVLVPINESNAHNWCSKSLS